jgi:hypothetical protein
VLKSCPVCDHYERDAVEGTLVRGEPYQSLTKQFRVSIRSMRRH